MLLAQFLQNLKTLNAMNFTTRHAGRTKLVNSFYRNDPGTGMYFIEDGSVELTVMSSQDDEQEIQDQTNAFLLNSPDSFQFYP